MTHEQFARYKFQHSEIIIYHQKHPTMDVKMMLCAVDFDNEVFKLAPFDTVYYEDKAIWVNRELCDKPRAIRMKVIIGKKQH